MSKSVYEGHAESSIFRSAELLVEWQKNLLGGRRKPNKPPNDKEQLTDCPPTESSVWDSYEHKSTIDDINAALRKIFILDDQSSLKTILDKFKPEESVSKLR